MRDYNKEARATADKQYDYEFDAIVRQYMMRTFAPFFRRGAALELGCHEGRSTALLADAFEDLTVVEASSDAIALAQQCVPSRVQFIHSTFEDCETRKLFTDIFLINTLEHIEETEPVLFKIKSWLRSDGLFFVLVPNADAPSRQLAVQMGLMRHNNSVTPAESEHGHRRTYSFDTLEADIRQAGFVIRQRGGLMFKALANFQIDKALQAGIIDMQYIEGMYHLGMIYPALCASIYLICELPASET